MSKDYEISPNVEMTNRTFNFAFLLGSLVINPTSLLIY